MYSKASVVTIFEAGKEGISKVGSRSRPLKDRLRNTGFTLSSGAEAHRVDYDLISTPPRHILVPFFVADPDIYKLYSVI